MTVAGQRTFEGRATLVDTFAGDEGGFRFLYRQLSGDNAIFQTGQDVICGFLGYTL